MYLYIYGYFSIKLVLKNLSIKDEKNFTISKKQFNTPSYSPVCTSIISSYDRILKKLPHRNCLKNYLIEKTDHRITHSYHYVIIIWNYYIISIVQYNPLENNLYIFPCRRVLFVICNEQNNVRQFRNKRNLKINGLQERSTKHFCVIHRTN